MRMIFSYVKFLNIGYRVQLDEPYGFPADHQPDATML